MVEELGGGLGGCNGGGEEESEFHVGFLHNTHNTRIPCMRGERGEKGKERKREERKRAHQKLGRGEGEQWRRRRW